MDGFVDQPLTGLLLTEVLDGAAISAMRVSKISDFHRRLGAVPFDCFGSSY